VDVTFKRTGARRYAVVLSAPGEGRKIMDPAPGYDDDLPHDLVHYVVEAELRLATGVFGRAAQGGGTFIDATESGTTPRERARQRRKQRRRENALRTNDEASADDMATSERLTALCDVAFRRRHGQHADPLRSAPEPLPTDDPACIPRVVDRLDALAPLWRALPVGGELVFEWPSPMPKTRGLKPS
jgi:hypothetical protein